MNDKLLQFIQLNSPDGGFLQSVYWRKFQDNCGRKTYQIEEKDENYDTVIYSHIISHALPIVGKYFYVPRGPIFRNYELGIMNYEEKVRDFFSDLISLARKNNIGWVRVEPANEKILNLIKKNLPKGSKIKKSSVDMQPKEILVLNISKSEEELLSQMKQKTRYNIRLAEKKNVEISALREQKYIDEFLRLVKITAKRDKIISHPEDYYRKMFESIPPEILKLYVAEYEGKIIAANLVLFFGKTATYMHGASDNIHRDVMAPYFLQWQQIIDAKKAGCERYDFGGVKVEDASGRSWAGVTKFKTGFAPNIKPVRFSGCHDIVLDFKKYYLYRVLQKVKRIF